MWPAQVRVRLTLLQGGLFALTGAALLAITYLLVSTAPRADNLVTHLAPGSAPAPADPSRSALTAATDRQRAIELHELLVRSGVALAITVVLSLAIGWLVAGRILRPLRVMTATIRRISAHTVHERLAAAGPRDELHELSDTVDGLLDRLSAALEAHKRFVGNAAHELRTTLTVEHALLEESLLDDDTTAAEFRAVAQRLLAMRGQQARLLESLLTLTESERGLDHAEPVDLAALAGQVVRARQPDNGIRLTTDLRPAAVRGDPALVERLIANLVDNALAYNTPNGFVTVHTGLGRGSPMLEVTNSGQLVPAEQVGRLFEPFQRLDRSADRAGHHGLGLSIVRAIATAHQAEIAAEARPDGGLAVTVTFAP